LGHLQAGGCREPERMTFLVYKPDARSLVFPSYSTIDQSRQSANSLKMIFVFLIHQGVVDTHLSIKMIRIGNIYFVSSTARSEIVIW
jgi:hypothetical protein